MVQIILLSLAACIAFNFLFVYVIDFKENILSYYNEKNRKRPIVDKKDPFDVFCHVCNTRPSRNRLFYSSLDR